MFRDHATAVGLVLHDLCGIHGALVSRHHTLETMACELNTILEHTPPELRQRWWAVEGGTPLCRCFVCPCCTRVSGGHRAGCRVL